ncbi:MAG: carbohydrate ABC transporter permease [Arachnia sp.]
MDAFSAAPVLFFESQWGNYVQAWISGGMAQSMVNSGVVAVASSAIGIACGLPLAYLITQVWPPESRASRRVTVFVLLLTTVPPVLGLTPLFRAFMAAGLNRSLLAIGAVHTYYAILLAVLIFRSFLENFSREIRESGLIDGCGEWSALTRCVMPSMIGPSLAVLVLALIQSWNEYLYALVLTGGNAQTVPVRVSSFLSFMGTNWANLTAAGVIGTIPIVIFAILARKQLARGLTYGGVK